MKIFKKIQVEETKVAEVICNMCGKSAMRDDGWGRSFYGHSLSYQGGYLSGPTPDPDYNIAAIRDEDNIEFDLCEVCIFDLSKTLKIPARFFDRNEYNKIEEAQEQIDKLFDVSDLDEIAEYLCSDNAEVRIAAELRREVLLSDKKTI